MSSADDPRHYDMHDRTSPERLSTARSSIKIERKYDKTDEISRPPFLTSIAGHSLRDIESAYKNDNKSEDSSFQ